MKRESGNSVTKNLTFRRVVIAKAEAIMNDTGEDFSGLCARLITAHHRELFGNAPSASGPRKPNERVGDARS